MSMDEGYGRSSVDNEAVREATLVDVRRMADNCEDECTERTRRFVESTGIKPWGFTWYVEWVASDRREEMRQKCLKSCREVQMVCPTTDKVERALAAASKATADAEAQAAAAERAANAKPTPTKPVAAAAAAKGGESKSWFGGKKQPATVEAMILEAESVITPAAGAMKPPGTKDDEFADVFAFATTDRFKKVTQNVVDPGFEAAARTAEVTPYRWKRCENVAMDFTRMLFTLAQKPTKVDFEDRDRDKKRDMMMGGSPTGPPQAQVISDGPLTTNRTTPMASRYIGAASQPLPEHMTAHFTEETQQLIQQLSNPGLRKQLYDSVAKAQNAQVSAKPEEDLAKTLGRSAEVPKGFK
jgi:hypothetical protein